MGNALHSAPRPVPEDGLTAEARFAIDEDQLAARVIDGEAIIINLATGLYYSADGTGAFVWERLTAGASLSEVAEFLSRRCGIDPDTAFADVRTFAGKALAEGLLEGRTAPLPDAPASEAEPVLDGPYAPPELHRYDDLEHFFALDPPLPDLPEQED